MKTEAYTHPTFGTPCSRQRRVQVLNTLAGKCMFHKYRARIVDTDYCEECLAKVRNGKTTYTRGRWYEVDWAQSDAAIAAKLKVSTTAVRRQRSKHAALAPGAKYTPKCGPKTPARHRVIQPEIDPRAREMARLTLNRAISTGVVTRKPCAVCGIKKAEAHHFDYTRPLEVIWLCKAHHSAMHKTAALRPHHQQQESRS